LDFNQLVREGAGHGLSYFFPRIATPPSPAWINK
jgi:hypothetical protein